MIIEILALLLGSIVIVLLTNKRCQYCGKKIKGGNDHVCEQMTKEIQRIQSDNDFVMKHKNAFKTTFEFICVDCGRKSEYKLICESYPVIVSRTMYIRCQDHINKN